MNKSKIYIPLLIIIIISFVGFLAYNKKVYKTAISEFTLTASAIDSVGISPKSHFIVKASTDLTPQVIEKYLKIFPSVDFSVTRVMAQANTFEVIPKNDLNTDTVYSIKIEKGPLSARDYSWAYQVKAPFQLINSLPGDMGTSVPVNTGIELYFNRDNIVNPEKYIEFSPAISGRFETKDNLVRYIPDVPLKEKKLYTVKIKPGMGAMGSTDTLEKEITFKFQTVATYSNTQPTISFSRDFSEFKTGTSIVFSVSSYNTESANISVYRLNSAEDVVKSVDEIYGDTPWRSLTSEDLKLPESQRVVVADVPIESSKQYYKNIRLPNSLPNGYYVATIKTGESSDITWFQVGPSASFTAFSSKNSLVWIKDINTGKNIRDARLIIDGKELGSTGKDGVLVFDTPKDLIYDHEKRYVYHHKFIIAKVPTGDLVIPIEGEYGYRFDLQPSDRWWNYISLNKEIYLPEDTIRFWAIAKPREDTLDSKEIQVTLSKPYWGYSESEKKVDYVSTKINLSDFDTVTGELSYSGLKPGIYELIFKSGEEIINRKIITVAAYIKPAYKISVESDKNTIFAEDTVTYKIKSEFFDGTPVANTQILYNTYGESLQSGETSGVLKLDEKGEASLTISSKYLPNSTRYSIIELLVRPASSEEGVIESKSSVFVFNSNIYNTITEEQKDKTVGFTIKTENIDLTRNQGGIPYWDISAYLSGPASGIGTQIGVSEVIYNIVQEGTYYDPINKLTYPQYRYTTEYKDIGQYSVTSDKDGIAKFSLKIDNKKMYRVIFTSTDNTGRAISDTRYVYGYDRDMYFNSSEYGEYYYMKSLDSDSSYKIGEKINIQPESQSANTPKADDYIFIKVNNGKLNYEIQASPKYQTIFTDNDTPNIGIWSAWFNGTYFRNAGLYNVSFDHNERRLKIQVKQDKDVYKPGDEVNLNIHVTDKNDKAVKSEVNLSALDEAVFSLAPNEADVVNELYADIYAQLILRTSNLPPYGGGGAEKGGGGDGDSVRSKIEEMAIFKSVETDSFGNASVKFKLPDNITSWRLTSQAFTHDLYAGKSIDFIKVTLPFFVDTTLNKTYLTGDKVDLRVRVFGNMVGPENINYELKSDTLDPKSIKVIGGKEKTFALNALTKGDHEFTVKASNGTYSDAISRVIKVLDTYFTKKISSVYKVDNNIKIKGNTSGYTTLTFGSFETSEIYNDLSNLLYSFGSRIDQVGTRISTQKLMNQYFKENMDSHDDIFRYQGYSGGYKLLTYSSEDLDISAMVANIFADTRSAGLQLYLSSSLEDKKADIHRISTALFGLSTYNTPILEKINAIKDDKNLSIKDKIYLALALDNLGDKETAREYYNQNILPLVQEKGSYAYVKGKNDEETSIVTAMTAALLARFEEPVAYKMYTYSKQNRPKETLTNFERILYIQSILPKLNYDDVGFSYTAGDKKGNVDIKKGESFKLILSTKELNSLKISNVKGNLGVVSIYDEETLPSSLKLDSNISLRRTYFVNGNITNSFKEGDLVQVYLSPVFKSNSLDGYYEITDYLPSGLRPADSNSYEYYQYNRRLYPTEINDQKVTFITNKSYTFPIYYWARVVTKGVYKADPAIMQSVNNLDSITVTNEAKIDIK